MPRPDLGGREAVEAGLAALPAYHAGGEHVPDGHPVGEAPTTYPEVATSPEATAGGTPAGSTWILGNPTPVQQATIAESMSEADSLVYNFRQPAPAVRGDDEAVPTNTFSVQDLHDDIRINWGVDGCKLHCSLIQRLIGALANHDS
jgi:hypothetical protein